MEALSGGGGELVGNSRCMLHSRSMSALLSPHLMPLIGVPRIISPDLLKILAEMGHGDELVLADCNFPAQSIAEAQGAAAGPRIVYSLAADNVQMLEAILKLVPLDQYVEEPAAIMQRTPADEKANFPVAIYAEFQKTLNAAQAARPAEAAASGAAAASAVNVKMEVVERFAFYEVR
jgi:L-fucose mutarotase